MSPGKDRDKPPFWRTKSLAQMTDSEWESLCDGCGRCCLVKLEEEEGGRIHFTDVACELFDAGTCRCRDYKHRSKKVSDCVRLTARNVMRLSWLPPTCAYRLIGEGRELYWWHPLVSGDPETVVAAGVSVKGKVAALENEVPEDEDLAEHIVSWPGKWPKGARAASKAKAGARGAVAKAKEGAGRQVIKK
jgi:hypothetical protein